MLSSCDCTMMIMMHLGKQQVWDKPWFNREEGQEDFLLKERWQPELLELVQ